MRVNYFFRHPNVGHSIHRVFRTIIGEVEKNATISSFEVPSTGSMPHDVIRNISYTYGKRNKNAIHHVTGHIHDVLLGLVGVKTILTVHDLVFLDNVKNPIKRAYKWFFWLYLPIKIADVVVCISNQTKENILSKIKTDKLKVIHNPIDPIFSYSPKIFNTQKPIILHIGTGWNKNLKRTIIALENIPCHLRIIGELKPSQLTLLRKYKIEFSNSQNLSDDDIKKEYIDCDIVNFPSLYEGFGMPVIEGQKTGRIVITSKIEPIMEVSGEAAILVNPTNINSIREGFLSIIANASYRDEIIKKGIQNSERFSIQNIASQYLKLYRNL